MPLVTLRTFRDPIDAELVRAKLESEGIQAFVFDQHTAGVQWLYSLAIGGVKVKIEQADLEAAHEAIRSETPDELEVEAERCPSCGSSDIHPSRLRRVSGAASLATGIPFVLWSRRWSCNTCDYAWLPEQDRDVPESPLTLEAERRVQEKHSYPLFRVLLRFSVGLLILWYIQHRIRNG